MSERRYVNTDGPVIHEDTLPADLTDADYGEWYVRSYVPGNVGCRVGPPVEPIRQRVELNSAIQCLREIAAMNRKAGSETAQHWLLQHGYPIEEGGYVPGAQGFGDAR
jgi:hypothetical protein